MKLANVFNRDNIYQAGLNLFTPRVQERKQQQDLIQADLTRSINERQAPLRQQRLSPAPVVRANPFATPAPTVPMVSAARSTPFYNEINTAAKAHGINPKFYDALIFAESSYNPNAVSKTGAIGLPQLQPTTLKELGYSGDPRKLTPQQQLEFGAKYLNLIYDQRQRHMGVTRPLTPLEWYHAYSFGPNTSQPISPQYQANWERAYGRY